MYWFTGGYCWSNVGGLISTGFYAWKRCSIFYKQKQGATNEDKVSVTVTSHDIAIAMSSSRADPVLGVIILIYWAFWRDLNIIEY